MVYCKAADAPQEGPAAEAGQAQPSPDRHICAAEEALGCAACAVAAARSGPKVANECTISLG